MSIVTARNGDQLLFYRPGVTTLAEYPDLPLVFACVVAQYQGKVLFIFDDWRQEWELPAGHIEAGETSLEACARELREESSQQAAGLTYSGIALIRSGAGRLEPGAMFIGELKTLQPFQPNNETSAICFLELRQPQTDGGHIDQLSVMLAELVLQEFR